MVFVFWGMVIGGLVLASIVANWLKREKYAELAAHMTQAEVSDASLMGSQVSGNNIAAATAIYSVEQHHNTW